MANRIASVDIVDGELIVTYQDGSTESLGPVPNLDPEELSAAVQRNAGDIAGLKRDVAALQEAVAGLGTSVETAEDDIDDLQEDVAELKNDFMQFPNGNYPQMGAGYANQLVSGLKKEDQTPYNFRAVPYDATLEELKKIVGVTTVNNQLSEMKTLQLEANVVSTPTIAAFSGTKTHRYLVMWKQVGSLTSSVRNTMQATDGETVIRQSSTENYHSSEGFYHWMPNVATFTDGQWLLAYWTHTASNAFSIDDIQLVDLTQDFGTTIADYVYNLEQATAGAGVAWLKTHFPKQFDSGYQAYDAGTLKSIEGLSGKKTVGFNQFNASTITDNAFINTTGDMITNQPEFFCSDYIQVMPNTAYYSNTDVNGRLHTHLFYDANKNFVDRNATSKGVFTTPQNAYYMRVNAIKSKVSASDICINLSDPTKNGTYEPYEAHSYALDSDVVLRGIPKLDSNNQLYYDGDEYLPDGTVNRRYGIVDLGTLTWNKQTESDKVDRYYTSDISTVVLKPSVSTMLDLVCARFIASIDPVYGRTLDNAICVLSSNGGLYISASGYTDASAFKTAMSGVYLVYAKQTPTTETADPYTTPQIISPDGTEEYIYEDGSFELPVGHSSEYPVDVSGQLDDILDTPSANGTYVLKATVTDGAVSYSWVADA